MSHESLDGRSGAHSVVALFPALLIVLLAGSAAAKEQFMYAGEPIHPGCVHALAMHQGDAFPVTAAVSLEGCATSDRMRAKLHYESDDLAVIRDPALTGEGSFGYRVINQLENGIFGLAIRRVSPDGSERVSLAAVQLVERAMMRQGSIVKLQLMELLGEVWIPGIELTSFRSVGNKVHFVSGVGAERVERDVDFTRLGKMRR
ncbi:MAG: hypothetical protein QNK04_02355 [Myxococcota bacterium]|nr:hypothetical protein [Myxococcota bacterium]